MRRWIILVLWLLLTHTGLTQDTTGTVIKLSDKVGTTIDLEERNLYRLFLSCQDFESAVFIQRPDSSYAFKITTRKNDDPSVVLVWKSVTKVEIENIRNVIETEIVRPRRSESTAGKIQTIRIVTTKGDKIKGLFQSLVEDTLFILIKKTGLSEADIIPDKIFYHEIAKLYIVRKASISPEVWLFVFGLTGGILGYLGGDDPPGMISFNAETKAFLGTMLGLLGSIPLIIFTEILTGVDIDVHWQEKTDAEKRIILEQIVTGRYWRIH